MKSKEAIEFFVETGAVSGTAIEKMISKIGTEIKERVLSKRENSKTNCIYNLFTYPEFFYERSEFANDLKTEDGVRIEVKS